MDWNSHTGDLYALPDDLAGITLEQHINWSSRFGYTLLSQARKRDLLETTLAMERIYMAISFYTGMEYEDVRDNEDTKNAIEGYALSAIQFAVEELAIDLSGDAIVWGGFTWIVNLPSASVSDPITQDEFRVTMKASKIINEIVNGDWQNAAWLLAVYFRHDGEAFDPILLDTRPALMLTLPLNLALGAVQILLANQTDFDETIDQFLTEYLP